MSATTNRSLKQLRCNQCGTEFFSYFKMRYIICFDCKTNTKEAIRASSKRSNPRDMEQYISFLSENYNKTLYVLDRICVNNPLKNYFFCEDHGRIHHFCKRTFIYSQCKKCLKATCSASDAVTFRNENSNYVCKYCKDSRQSEIPIHENDFARELAKFYVDHHISHILAATKWEEVCDRPLSKETKLFLKLKSKTK